MKDSKSNENAELRRAVETAGIGDSPLEALHNITKQQGRISDVLKSAGIGGSPLATFESIAREQSGISDMLRSAGISDAAHKAFESIANQPSVVSDMLKSASIGDAAHKAFESIANQRGGASDVLKSFQIPGISEELRRSLESTDVLARNVDQALSGMHFSAPSFEVPQYELPQFEVRELPNPIWETNSHLSELTNTVTQLVDVARQQAELAQAIRATSDLALKCAIQSGEDAKAATLLARKSVRLTLLAIAVAIITAVVSMAVSYKLSDSTDVRLQEEIHLLRDISGNLQQLNRGTVIAPPVTPKEPTEQPKGLKGLHPAGAP